MTTIPVKPIPGPAVQQVGRRAPSVYVSSLDDGYLGRIRDAFQWIGLDRLLRGSGRVFVKPNLTFPVYRKGVMTNPDCVEALIVALKDYTKSIVVGEADSGGYNRFSMDDVLSRTGILELGRRYGVQVVNLSHLPSASMEVATGRGKLLIPFPRLLLDETDLLVTVPVPKVHMNTVVSLALKNQWGCIPDPHIRLRLHPHFEPVIVSICERLQPAVAVVDGRYGLNKSGPMRGSVVDLNWLLVSDDIYAAEQAGVYLMGIDPESIPLMRFLKSHGPRLHEPTEIRWNADPHSFRGVQFQVKRELMDYPGYLAFRSRLLTWLAYYSPAATALHKLLYLFREPFYDYEDPRRTEN